jgi:tetratricopeptide (TPR) repeat protein
VVLGTEHPNYIICLESLSGLYFTREEHLKALPIYRKVLAARRRKMGNEHPGTIVAIFNLAGVLHELGKLQEAEVLTREALDLRLKFRGEQHPFTQQTRYLMALLMIQRGAEDEALEQLTIAVDHGFAHPLLLDDNVLEIFSPLRGRAEFETLLTTVRLRLENK